MTTYNYKWLCSIIIIQKRAYEVQVPCKYRHLVANTQNYITVFRNTFPTMPCGRPQCSTNASVLVDRVSSAAAVVVHSKKYNMASDGPPGTESLQSDLGSAIVALNTWSHPELQAKLGELGAPNMGEQSRGDRRPLELTLLAPCQHQLGAKCTLQALMRGTKTRETLFSSY